MSANSNPKINKLTADRDIYRSKISTRLPYRWNINYRHSDLYVASDKDVAAYIAGYLVKFYTAIETVIDKNPVFLKALSPVALPGEYAPVIGQMLAKSRQFKVGPMAAVAGAVCDYLGQKTGTRCSELIIENGGDTYIKSSQDITAQVFTANSNLTNNINLHIPHQITPCGLCCSSGKFGHSFSMGKADIACVLATTAIAADAAATAMANCISSPEHVERAIEKFKSQKGILGLLALKDKTIGIWGQVQLVP